MARTPIPPYADEQLILAALRPWQRRLQLESALRWVVRGLIAAGTISILLILVGWVTPWPETEAHRTALLAALPLLLLALGLGLWPVAPARRAAELDDRLHLADRLATAWHARTSAAPMARLQRSDAVRQLASRSPRRLPIRWSKAEAALLAGVAVATLALALARSPMELTLAQQASRQAAARRAAAAVDQQYQALRRTPGLTPDQVAALDSVLPQVEQQVVTARSQDEAQQALAQGQQAVKRLVDPAASSKERGLEAAGAQLSGSPQTQALGDALGALDSPGTSAALQQLAAQLSSMSDDERQALAQSLKRSAAAARGNPAAAGALQNASRAATDPSADASRQLQATASELDAALQAARAQSALADAARRLGDAQQSLTSDAVGPAADSSTNPDASGAEAGPPQLASASAGGSPGDMESVPPSDAANTSGMATLADGAGGSGHQGGLAAGSVSSQPAPSTAGVAAESVFVPGRRTDQPEQEVDTAPSATSAGQSHPYTDVLAQYAQSGRDYVDHSNMSADVRDLVKQYFSELEDH